MTYSPLKSLNSVAVGITFPKCEIWGIYSNHHCAQLMLAAPPFIYIDLQSFGAAVAALSR
jgi:hypothetical protein